MGLRFCMNLIIDTYSNSIILMLGYRSQHLFKNMSPISNNFIAICEIKINKSESIASSSTYIPFAKQSNDIDLEYFRCSDIYQKWNLFQWNITILLALQSSRAKLCKRTYCVQRIYWTEDEMYFYTPYSVYYGWRFL